MKLLQFVQERFSSPINVITNRVLSRYTPQITRNCAGCTECAIDSLRESFEIQNQRKKKNPHAVEKHFPYPMLHIKKFTAAEAIDEPRLCATVPAEIRGITVIQS